MPRCPEWTAIVPMALSVFNVGFIVCWHRKTIIRYSSGISPLVEGRVTIQWKYFSTGLVNAHNKIFTWQDRIFSSLSKADDIDDIGTEPYCCCKENGAPSP